MYRLYYCPTLASMAPHIVLREIGAPHELVEIDRAAGGNRTPEYLALNPLGRIPAFTDGDLALYEAAAICLHLSDRHPEAGLMPPVGGDDRAQAYKWLIFLTNTLQTEILLYFYAERYVPAEDADRFKATVEARIAGHLEIIDRALDGRDWLVGGRATLPDLYFFMLGRWTRNMARPARGFANLGPYLDRLFARPSVREVHAIERIAAPFY